VNEGRKGGRVGKKRLEGDEEKGKRDETREEGGKEKVATSSQLFMEEIVQIIVFWVVTPYRASKRRQ
jgi:hypothetical protein